MSKEQVAVTLVRPNQKEHTIWGFSGQTIFDILLLQHFELEGYCGGNGICGKCKLKATGHLSEITATEREMLLPEEIKHNIRLACRAVVNGPATVYIDNYTSYHESLFHHGMANNLETQEVKLHKFFISGLDKSWPVPIHRRIMEALADYELRLTPDNLNEISSLDRAGRPALKLYASIFQDKFVRYVSRTMEGVYGIALDLGSTSLFGVLVNLVDGQVVAVVSKANMQRIYGADIISRLSYSVESQEGEANLQQILINNINSMVEELIGMADVLPRQVYSYSVVGNPVILHFLTKVNVKGFTSFPYLGVFVDAMKLNAKDLGIIGHQEAQVYLLPQVGGFIGADTIGVLLTLEKNRSSYLMIDIGTNGEIVLHKDGQVWVTSAAAGPAFEGGQISCGIRASSGSIDRVYLDDTGQFKFGIIGNSPVRGICGSGIIDLVACLLKADYIDTNGIIQEGENGELKTLKHDYGRQLVVYDGDDILPGQPILFTQEDIRQVQLAKSAIRTALDLLLEEAEVDYQELDNIYLAGAFGNYLNPLNTINIGLLPDIEPSRVINIGNAAANGAVLALLSPEKRAYASDLAKKVNYVELANSPNFQARFLDNLNFSPIF